MKIDESLNLVLPLGESLMVYHSPISRAVFEANYKALAATKAALASKGVHYQMDAGPRIASLLLMDEVRRDADADKDGLPDESAGRAFLAELRRLSMVMVASQNGWDLIPVDAAINTGKVDAEEWQEVESALVFFTCHYAMARKADRQSVGIASASLLRAYTTSSACSEYAASLPKLTTAEITAASAGSSVPR
ncbi:MAG: hypothetical protein ACYC4K_02865 [Thiobacillus sp.]